MKKTLLTTVLFLALSAAAFAAGKDKELLNNLSATLKNSKQVTWSSGETHNNASFGFNGQTVVAYYYKEDDNLIGYSIHLTAANLPQSSKEAIEKKYPGFAIIETTMFIDANGNANHFVLVKNGKKGFALKVDGSKVSYFDRIPN